MILYWNCVRLLSNLTNNSSSEYLNALDRLKEENQLLIVKDFLWSYILPFVCLFGILTNALNVSMFVKREHFQHKIYRYLLAHSVSQLAYLILGLNYFLLKSTYISARIHRIYMLKYYELIFDIYLTTTLSMFMVFIELVISLSRLFMIFGIKLKTNLNIKQTTLVYLIVSSLVSIPTLFLFRVVKVDELCRLPSGSVGRNNAPTSFIYDLAYEFGREQATIKISAALRALILPFVLITTNLIIYFDFRRNTPIKRLATMSAHSSKHMRRNQQQPNATSNNQRAASIVYNSKKSLTRLVISINFLFIISNLSSSVSTIFFFLYGFSSYYTTLAIVIQASLYTTIHSISFFVYLSFDQYYFKIFLFYVRKLISKKDYEL